MPVILQTTAIFTYYSMASFTGKFFILKHTNTNFIYWSAEIWFCYQAILDAQLFLQPHHVPTRNTQSLNYKKKSLSSTSSGMSQRTCFLSTTTITMATRMTHSLSHTQVLHTGRCLKSFLLPTSSLVQSKIFSLFSYTRL